MIFLARQSGAGGRGAFFKTLTYFLVAKQLLVSNSMQKRDGWSGATDHPTISDFMTQILFNYNISFLQPDWGYNRQLWKNRTWLLNYLAGTLCRSTTALIKNKKYMLMIYIAIERNYWRKGRGYLCDTIRLVNIYLLCTHICIGRRENYRYNPKIKIVSPET